MMTGIILGGLVVLGLIIGAAVTSGKGQKKLVKENIPENLGVLNLDATKPLLDLLDNALDDEYIRQVKHRFLQENPKRSEDEFEWLLFEMKRYFIVANLLKNVPMFSKEVDEIWHEMILFTKNYERFSDKFFGEMLHHIPNTKPEPAPQERAYFDWIFSQLFEVTEFSWKVWGSFFNHPFASEMLKEFEESTQEKLIDIYFRKSDENKELSEYLVNKMKNQLKDAEAIYKVDKKGSFKKPETYGNLTSLSLAMIFFSTYHHDEYWDYAKEMAFNHTARETSGCTTAFFCGTGSSDSSGGGHGDGGGGSSCSSCGGGCSS